MTWLREADNPRRQTKEVGCAIPVGRATDPADVPRRSPVVTGAGGTGSPDGSVRDLACPRGPRGTAEPFRLRAPAAVPPGGAGAIALPRRRAPAGRGLPGRRDPLLPGRPSPDGRRPFPG